MKETDVTWAAGIIEGEGSLVLSTNSKNKTRRAAIQVDMTDKDTIYRLHELLGGRVYVNDCPSKYKRFPNAKVSWRLMVIKQKEVFDALLHIMPHLGERRLKKAKELFNYLEPKVCV